MESSTLIKVGSPQKICSCCFDSSSPVDKNILKTMINMINHEYITYFKTKTFNDTWTCCIITANIQSYAFFMMRLNGYTPSAHSFPSHTPLSQVYRLIPQKEPKYMQSCCTKIQRILQSLTIIQFDPFILHTSHLFECLTHTSTISLFSSRWVPGLVKYHLKARDSKQYLASHRASGVYSLRSGCWVWTMGRKLRPTWT